VHRRDLRAAVLSAEEEFYKLKEKRIDLLKQGNALFFPSV
jgi:hypothetical protein